jgi:AcrR family transcriptional regulator
MNYIVIDIERDRIMADRGRPRGFDRQEALARAMELFWARGYEGSSISDLTNAMGIASPSLYAAFGSKEALFQEAVAHYKATEGPEILAAMDVAPAIRDAVEAYLTTSALTFTRRGKPRGCMIVLSGLTPATTNDELCVGLRNDRAANIDSLETRLKLAVAAKQLSAKIDARAVATFYVTVQQGMAIQARDGATRATLMRIAYDAMKAWPALTGVA